MTKKEKNKYYVGGSSSRCCRVSIASHTRRFNFSHFHPPCLLIYTKQRNKSRKDSINVKKKKIEKTIRQTYNIHPQMGIPPLTTAVHCVCDSFQFGFFLERRGRPIGRNGGLRQRQPCHRSGRQRSARLPSSGLKKKQFPKLRQVIKTFFLFRFHVSHQVNHPQACYAKICRSDIDCLGGKTERVCCYNGYTQLAIMSFVRDGNNTKNPKFEYSR